MTRRAPVFLGIALGLAAALLLINYGIGRPRHVTTPMLPDFGGPVRAAVLQFAHGSDVVFPVYRQYLEYQPPSFTAYIACPEESDFLEIKGHLDRVGCRLIPVYTHHEQTAWSRDRWVAIPPQNSSLPVTLLPPKGEHNSENWPQRAGDSRIADDLARALPNEFVSRRSNLYFDGGDFLADAAFLFTTRAVLERNLQHTVTTRDKLLEALSQELGLTPILLDEGPQHHAGMFMMSAGPEPSPSIAPPTATLHRVMVVADPSLGKPLYHSTPESDAAFTGGPDFSPETQKRFDSVALTCTDLGYRVVRIPVVPAAAGKMYVTYVNVILDREPNGQKLAYMPIFDGQPDLNTAATKVWSNLGFRVRPINCTTVWQLGGTLHCLVNVHRRDP